ncbi:MAG: DNA primase [Eubacteriales bacterium]
MVDQSIVEEIKLRNPIDEVVSAYVSLKRAGSNYVGLCPFHSEKSPSFTVFQNDGSFYCFGCGAGGDVITFIRRAENLDYPSALVFLAKRAGITITSSRDEKNESERRNRTLAMNREAAKYFNHILLDTPEGKPGLDYLLSRGLTLPVIRHFGLGFAPDDFGAVPKLLSSMGYTDAEMSSAYLARISEKTKRPYGLFRNRVMFPIIATTGDVVAFGGRVMDDSKPKYLNSSDTPAFKKSKNLFALNFAKNNCAEQLILCEGYMDVIALHAAGFTNAVATLGTAITPEQARIFKRYTKSVLICYDADEAGQNAASKAFRLLGEVGLECKILKVKNAKDPDEYLKKYGPAAFKKLMEGSRTEFDFRYDRILSDNDITDAQGKIRALDACVRLIASEKSAARREIYIARVSKELEIPADAIRRDVEKQVLSENRTEKREETTRLMRQSAGIGDRVNPDRMKNLRAASAEDAIFGILMIHPEYIGELRNQGLLPKEEDFVSSFGKKVYGLMLACSESGAFDESVLNADLTEDEIGRLNRLRIGRRDLSDNSVKILLECYQTLQDAARDKNMNAVDIINKKRQKKQENGEK